MAFTQQFGDRAYTFELDNDGMMELQQAAMCDAGPLHIYNRLQLGSYLIQDVREPIRQGLIGGGMNPNDALALRDRYCGKGQIEQNVPLAAKIVAQYLREGSDEELPKAEASKAPE